MVLLRVLSWWWFPPVQQPETPSAVGLVGLTAVALFLGLRRPTPGLSPRAARLESELKTAFLAITAIRILVVWAHGAGVITATWPERLVAALVEILFWGVILIAGGAPRVERSRASLPVRALAAALGILSVAKVSTNLVYLIPLLRGVSGTDVRDVVVVVQLGTVVVWHVVSLVAAAVLTKGRPWARQWLVASSAVSLAATVVAQSLAPDGMRLWDVVARELRHQPWMAAWTLAPDVLALVTVVVLTRPVLAAALPPVSPAGRRLAVAAALAFEVVWFAPQWMHLPPPRPGDDADAIAGTTVEPGVADLTVHLVYDGRPVEGVRDRPLRLWLTDVKGTAQHAAETTADDTILARNVPTGVYRVVVAVDADARNDLGTHDRGMPGDLVGESKPFVLRPSGAVADVELWRVIRLLEPEDSLHGLRRDGKTPPPPVSSPVRFSWDVVPGADQYGVSVTTFRDGHAIPETSAVVREPRWTVQLPPSRPGDAYHFSVSASAGRRQLGGFQVEGFGWYGWDYDFTVAQAFDDEPPTPETWMMLPPLRGNQPDFAAPLDRWCAITEHPSATVCQAALANLLAQHMFGIDMWSYYGARCMPRRDVHRPSRSERLRVAVEAALRRAAGDGADVGEPARLGLAVAHPPTLVVVDHRDGRPLLAVDVTTRDGGDDRYAIAAGWAKAGFPSVLFVRQPPSPGVAEVFLYQRWDAETERWVAVRGAGTSGGTLTTASGLAIAADGLLLAACP